MNFESSMTRVVPLLMTTIGNWWDHSRHGDSCGRMMVGHEDTSMRKEEEEQKQLHSCSNLTSASLIKAKLLTYSFRF